MNNQKKVLLVDGHSIIFQWPDLHRLHQAKSLAARQELIRLMIHLQDITGWHVVLVFDGTGSKTQPCENAHPIQVFYSKASQTADSVIERLTAKYVTQYDITVATDDSGERETILAIGAHWISSIQLRNYLNEANQNLQETLRQMRNAKRGMRK